MKTPGRIPGFQWQTATVVDDAGSLVATIERSTVEPSSFHARMYRVDGSSRMETFPTFAALQRALCAWSTRPIGDRR